MDGDQWADGVFPSNFQVPDTGFTILDTSESSVFLQVLKDRLQNRGTLFRSNWNGTYYSLLLENVNEDNTGHVDFEKVIALDGVVIANQIQSSIETDRQIVTKVSYDNGI